MVGVGAWHTMHPNGDPEESSSSPAKPHGTAVEVIKEEETMAAKPSKNYPIASMVNDNIIIIETSPRESVAVKCSGKKLKENGRVTKGGGGGRAGATVRSLSDAELPDPETVRKVKDAFEALAKQQQTDKGSEKSSSDSKSNIGRSKSMIIFRGRAWCNGGPGIAYHRHGACDSAIHTLHTVGKPSVNPKSYQRSCSELDQFFQNITNQESTTSEEIWERYVNQDRGSPVSPEVIAKIRQHGTCVKFFGAEAQAITDFNSWEDDNDSLSGGNGYLIDYSLINHQHKPKIIGAIHKANSSGSGSSCASSTSTFDDWETCSSCPSSPYSWLHLGGTLERLRTVFGGDENDNFRLPNNIGSSANFPFESAGYVKSTRNRNDDEDVNDCHNLKRSHGIWRKNPCWPGSYYIIYDFTVAKDGSTTPSLSR